jgi:arsenate reductase
MAEGWAHYLKTDTIEAYSAGIETHGLNPMAAKVMAEAGVDISTQKSQHVDELKHIDFDYVVTVCDNAAESCPVFSGNAKVIHQPFDDPPRLVREASSEEEGLAHYRRVRDELRDYVASLPDTLENSNHG